MAVKKMRKLAILAKLEAAYGVDIVPTGAANAMVVSDVEITPLDGDEVERNNVQPYFGHSGTLQATQFARIKFNVEMAGSGVAGTAPKYDALLQACGAAATIAAGVSVTYAPISDDQKSVSIYANVDGINHIMPGVRGECKATLDAKGKPVWQFEFMGLWTALADTAMPATVYAGWVKPVAINKVNTICTLHGVVSAMSHFDMAFGNQVVKRDLTDVDTVEITDRKSTGSIMVQNVALATKDWVGTAQAKTLGDLSIVHGTVGGNIVTFGGTGTVELGKPSYSNQDGVQMVNMPLKFQPTSAGNDEWSIVFT